MNDFYSNNYRNDLTAEYPEILPKEVEEALKVIMDYQTKTGYEVNVRWQHKHPSSSRFIPDHPAGSRITISNVPRRKVLSMITKQAKEKKRPARIKSIKLAYFFHPDEETEHIIYVEGNAEENLKKRAEYKARDRSASEARNFLEFALSDRRTADYSAEGAE